MATSTHIVDNWNNWDFGKYSCCIFEDSASLTLQVLNLYALLNLIIGANIEHN